MSIESSQITFKIDLIRGIPFESEQKDWNESFKIVE